MCPEMVRAYLEARGYGPQDGSRDVYAIGGKWASLPAEVRPGWAVDLGWVLEAAATHESRSPLAVLADIRASWVRALLAERDLRASVSAHGDGTIGVGLAVAGGGVAFAWGYDIGPGTDWRAWADGVAAWWRS